MFRNENALPPISDDEEFDLIVVGSGNGACGFLGECLKHVPSDYRILVLEQGQNYFYTSDITHQNGWSKSYGTGDIFQPHNTVTPDGRSVLSGRAKTMGGGGSINYTMIHESSEWLVKQAGRDVAYWNECKKELNDCLNRPNPFTPGFQTPFAKFIESNAKQSGFMAPNKRDMIGNIPSISEASNEDTESKRIYIFPTQFNQFGQRTNSGVSLVQWERVRFRWNTSVTDLVMAKSDTDPNIYTCTAVQTKNKKGVSAVYKVKNGSGRVVLCGGSESPRLLLQTKELADENPKIGTRVNDHICMPLAIYVVEEEQALAVGPTNIYESLFATENFRHGDKGGEHQTALVCFDFFTGDFPRLVYIVSSLYLCFLPVNWFKRFMGRNPIVFTYLSNIIRVLLTGIIYIIDLFSKLAKLVFRKNKRYILTTSLLKFNATREGYYEKKGDRITLRFFEEDDEDFVIAEQAINKNIDFLESNGKRPNFLVRFLFQFITKIPYEKGRQVKKYVRHFSRKTLLSEQHLAGGCVFGDVVDMGLESSASTGKVFGSDNIHVADLSVVPLPRVSTQMTAYLMGHHVAKQLYSCKKSD